MTYTYQKSVYVDRLEIEIKANASLLAKYSHIVAQPGTVNIVTSSDLTAEEEDALEAIVTAHVAQPTTSQMMRNYLDGDIFPFVKDVISDFAAENIAMGITQAGKTGHVLALFGKKYPVPNATFQNSLKESFDTGSLYVSIAIIQYIRDNPTEFDGLSPFVTDARLRAMKNRIEAKLGIPLT